MVRRFSDGLSAAVAIADEIARCIEASEGSFHLALSGGTSPVPTFQELRQRELSWERVHIWLVDERFVPVGDPGSNERLVREELTDHVTILESNIHGMLRGVTAADCAAGYEKILPSQLDFVMLGMGGDGHTASLFPGSPALGELDRRVVAAPGVEPYPQRVTLTFPVLADAKHLAVLATGAGKAPAFADAMTPESDLPIARLARLAPHLEWFVDAAISGS